MHRGCVPFVSRKTFDTHYWPTVKPIIEELWKNGHQTLFYSEGDWTAHLDSFAELPDQSIVYHVDRGDIFKTHQKLGHKFCLSGGIPNMLLSYGKPDEVRDYCKKVIDGVAADGGYIMDASAIMQNDTSIENLRTMTEFTREYGVYSDGRSRSLAPAPTSLPEGIGMPHTANTKKQPGVCFPWEEKCKELPEITGDQELMRRIWQDIDSLGNMYVWQVLLSF
jgi:hypothetical protein